MNFKTTVILLVLLAGVGIFVAVERFRSTDDAVDTAEATDEKLLDVAAADLERVSITPQSGEKLVLERKGADWRLVEPVQAPAETFAVDALVREITELRSRNQVALDPATTGLQPPRYTVELVEKGGKKYTLAVGNKSAVADILYVRLGESGKADVVSAGLTDRLDQPVSEYRKTRLIEASQDQIQSVTLVRPESTIKLEKKDGEWKVVEPAPMPGDPSEVSGVLSGITGLNAVEFVAEDAAKAAQYGLDEPTVTVSFTAQPPAPPPPATQEEAPPQPPPAPTTTTVKFGHYEDVLKKNVYALIGEGPVVKVPASSVEAFKKSPLDLRDRKVLDVDPQAVQKVTIQRDLAATTQPKREASNSTIVLARREEKVEPAGPPAPPKKTDPGTPETTPPKDPAAEPRAESPAPAESTPPVDATAPQEPEAAAPAEASPPAEAAPPAESDIPTDKQPEPRAEAVEDDAVLAAAQETAEPEAKERGDEAPAEAPVNDAPPADPASAEAAAPAEAAPMSEPMSEWVLLSEPQGDAHDPDVQSLLNSFHPLRAQKYLEAPPKDLKAVGTYVVTIVTESQGDAPAQTYEVHLTDPGRTGQVIGKYGDLTFEVDRSLLQKLEGDFARREEEPQPPQFPGGGGFGSPLE